MDLGQQSPESASFFYPPRPHWWALVEQLDAETLSSASESERPMASVQTRRAHKKSRNGCGSCKRRRVKCDEQGPPCGQCALKHLECAFPDASQANLLTTSGDDDSTAPASDGLEVSVARVSRPSSPRTLRHSPTPSSSRRLLDLELMNQWSAETYKVFCGTAIEEYHTWQVLIPREGLRHDYLLHGILAMAALEIAMASQHEGPSDYVNIALEYQNLASSSFRAELSNVTEANSQAIFAFSLVTMILSIALPPFMKDHAEPISMLDSQVLHYELLRGVGLIVQSSRDWLESGPLLRNAERYTSLPIGQIDADTQAAVDRLNTVNNEKHDLARVESRPAKAQAMKFHAACRKAIFYLEECFARCIEPLQRGHALAWLGLSGPEYVSAIKQKNAVALLIMMHWGVLAERASYDVWYAQSVGKNLVREVSEIMAPDDDPTFNVALQWTRDEVGL